jgi:hypothetical protein
MRYPPLRQRLPHLPPLAQRFIFLDRRAVP